MVNYCKKALRRGPVLGGNQGVGCYNLLTTAPVMGVEEPCRDCYGSGHPNEREHQFVAPTVPTSMALNAAWTVVPSVHSVALKSLSGPM